MSFVDKQGICDTIGGGLGAKGPILLYGPTNILLYFTRDTFIVSDGVMDYIQGSLQSLMD